jgi:sortase A
MRLQFFRRGGSLLALTLGIAISLFSLQGINESSAGSQFIPALDAIDKSSTSLINPAAIKVAKGDFIGTLAIPRINKVISIYEGTEESQLKKGAGHYIKSVLPGAMDNSVIAGHRDSVFSKFGSLKVGDPITVTTSYGKFVYIIDSFRIVKADDRTVIVPTKEATLTLSTCYPFRFVGNAPKRFIVTALLAS